MVQRAGGTGQEVGAENIGRREKGRWRHEHGAMSK